MYIRQYHWQALGIYKIILTPPQMQMKNKNSFLTFKSNWSPVHSTHTFRRLVLEKNFHQKYFFKL